MFQLMCVVQQVVRFRSMLLLWISPTPCEPSRIVVHSYAAQLFCFIALFSVCSCFDSCPVSAPVVSVLVYVMCKIRVTMLLNLVSCFCFQCEKFIALTLPHFDHSLCFVSFVTKACFRLVCCLLFFDLSLPFSYIYLCLDLFFDIHS